MPGKLFHIGQEVTPLFHQSEWILIGIQYGPLPKYGNIYTVAEHELDEDTWMIVLKELHPNDSWEETAFAPVLPQDAIEELMQSSHEKEWTQQQYY